MNRMVYIVLGCIVLLMGCGKEQQRQERPESTSTPFVTPVPIVITFEDDNFEQVIRKALAKPEGTINTNDMESITSLNINNEQIESIAEIKYCKYLTDLSLSVPKVTDLTGIGELELLSKLKVSKQSINGLPNMEKCTLLSSLHISQCNIKSLAGMGKNNGINTINIQNCKIDYLFDANSWFDRLFKITINQCHFNKDLKNSGYLPGSKLSVSCKITHNNLTTLRGAKTFFANIHPNRLNLNYNQLTNIEDIGEIKFSTNKRIFISTNCNIKLN